VAPPLVCPTIFPCAWPCLLIPPVGHPTAPQTLAAAAHVDVRSEHRRPAKSGASIRKLTPFVLPATPHRPAATCGEARHRRSQPLPYDLSTTFPRKLNSRSHLSSRARPWRSRGRDKSRERNTRSVIIGAFIESDRLGVRELFLSLSFSFLVDLGVRISSIFTQNFRIFVLKKKVSSSPLFDFFS
ncbi:Unknown protein, partial [Striga hermonthica]